MKNVVTVAVVSFLCNLALASAKRALTIEDYYRIKTIGDAQISPNGQWVAYSLSTRIEEDNTTSTETYVVNADGSGTARRIMHAGGNVAEPAMDRRQPAARTRWRCATPSAVFIGGPAETRAPRAAGTRFKVAIDTPNATPV